MAVDGILLVDKERGWTSHDVVARLRRLTGERRIGHTGTLDPAATGLLVVCLGRATRLVEYMVAHDKRYEGEITLGTRTTTDDAEGAIVTRAPVPEIAVDELRKLEAKFTGSLQQTPPAFSAVKVGGRRAYAVAREGGSPGLTPRTVSVRHLQLEQLAPDRLAVDVQCGPGTYIRSLARDIGEEIGCGAHLASLRRVEVGPYVVDRASGLEELHELTQRNRLRAVMLAPDEGIAEMPAALIAEQPAARLAQGMTVETGHRGAVNRLRIYSSAGLFVGVGAMDESGLIRCRKVLLDASG